MGRYVQFGKYCSVAANLVTGNYVLFAGKVSFVGGNDHQIHLSGTTIWQSPRGEERDIIVGMMCGLAMDVLFRWCNNQ